MLLLHAVATCYRTRSPDSSHDRLTLPHEQQGIRSVDLYLVSRALTPGLCTLLVQDGRRDRRRECVTAVGQIHVKQMSSIPTGRIAVKDEAFTHDISVVCDLREHNLFTFRSHMALCKHTGGTVGG